MRAHRLTILNSRRGLYAQQNVTVLPGSFLSREAHGSNPARITYACLGAPLADCIDAAHAFAPI